MTYLDPTNSCVRLDCVGQHANSSEEEFNIWIVDNEPPRLRHSRTSGFLSALYKGEERGVCDDGFNEKSALVACK